MPIPGDIIDLVGPPSREEVARLYGRKSPIRELARDLGIERYLPEPPPIAEDESLRCAEVDAARHARKRHVRRRIRKQAGIPVEGHKDGYRKLREWWGKAGAEDRARFIEWVASQKGSC